MILVLCVKEFENKSVKLGLSHLRVHKQKVFLFFLYFFLDFRGRGDFQTGAGFISFQSFNTLETGDSN